MAEALRAAANNDQFLAREGCNTCLELNRIHQSIIHGKSQRNFDSTRPPQSKDKLHHPCLIWGQDRLQYLTLKKNKIRRTGQENLQMLRRKIAHVF